ncbi:MAG: queuosine salvage family protein, partial [Chloroflexota bacterium]
TYTDALAGTIAQRALLPPGSEAEVEIRAATIWGVEFLRRALTERGLTLRPFEIDWHLWELGQTLPADTQPYHLTRTIFY